MTSLVLMPDGITFKKLNKAEEQALKRYYRKQNPLTLDKASDILSHDGVLIAGGLIIATSIAATAWIFRERIKDKVLTRLEKGGIIAGLGVAKLITQFIRGQQDRTEPQQPEVTPQGNVLTRCQRYEADYVEQNTIAEGIPFGIGTVLQALSQLNTIQSMKIEGCSRPSIIPQGQWDQG